MRMLLAAMVVGACIIANAAQPRMIPVTKRNGVAYVSAAELERSAGIAVKKLPGNSALVVCLEDRCAQIQDFLREKELTWVKVTSLAKALDLAARFSDGEREVRFEAGLKSGAAGGPITRVGELAPNFRLARLDGAPVALEDFRGKRVLIQSWASW